MADTYVTGKNAIGTEIKFRAVDASVSGNTVVGTAHFTVAAPAGGCLAYKSLDIDETEEQVKATAGNVYGFSAQNVSGAIRYLKFYNNTAAGVTVGTTVPDMTFALPFVTSGVGDLTVTFPTPVEFGTAITVACTTGAADNNSGAPGGGDVILTVFYK